MEILQWALNNGCEWEYMLHGSYNNVEILQLTYEHCVLYNYEVTSTDAECLDFLEGEYGEAWKKENFELPHYWKCDGIKGANE